MPGTWWRAANNLALLLDYSDLNEEAVALYGEIEAQARQRGDRERLAAARTSQIPPLVELGRWQEALDRAREAAEVKASQWAVSEVVEAVPVLCERGDLDAAEALVRSQEWQRDVEQREFPVAFAGNEARLLRARARPLEALAAAENGLAHRADLGIASRYVSHCLLEALEAALELGDLAKADDLLATVDELRPGELTPSLAAQRDRFHARLDASHERHEQVERHYRAAERGFEQHGLVFDLAVTRLEHGEWLARRGRPGDARPLLAEARETFERLEAKPRLERLAAAEAAAPVEVTA